MDIEVENVLILSPHTDDMELGAGATVRILVENGVNVKSVVFSDCKQSVDTSKYPEDVLRTECEAAAANLGIKDFTIHDFRVREFPSYRQQILETIYKLRKENEFELVFAPWHGDLHQDHRVVAEEALRAFMKTDTSILSYTIPGNCPDFVAHVYIPLSEEDVTRKVALLREYKSQVEKRGYFEINAIKGLMHFYGLLIGADYAEAFSSSRTVISKFKKI